MKKRLHISNFMAVAVAVLGILFPGVAAALGACVDPAGPKNEVVEAFEYLEQARAELAKAELAMSVKPETPEPDCSTTDESKEDDPAFAACYEAVDLPVSTIPSLFAQHQADKASNGVLGTVGSILGKSIQPPTVQPDPSEASVEMTPAQRVRDAWQKVAQSMPKQEAACTTYSPDNCRSAPAVPTFWFPEVSSSAATNSLYDLDAQPLAELSLDSSPLTDVGLLASRFIEVPVPPPQ